MRNWIKDSINSYNHNIYNNFENLWKTEFNIFKSDLNQYLEEKFREPIAGFISFESLSKIILSIKNMFDYQININSIDYLNNFRYPFLLNIRLPFKRNGYKTPSILSSDSFDFINKDGTRQLYFSLLDRKYTNKWYIPTENRYINKNRTDIKYVYNKTHLTGKYLNYTNYYILGINNKNDLYYIPIDNKDIDYSKIKLIKYTEIIQISFQDFYFNFSITPFGVLIWDYSNRDYSGNITKLIEKYEY